MPRANVIENLVGENSVTRTRLFKTPDASNDSLLQNLRNNCKMTLNPSAAVFVPSMKTLHLAKTCPVPTSSTVGQSQGVSTHSRTSTGLRHEFRQAHPPHLAPLYLNADEIRIQQQINRQHGHGLSSRAGSGDQQMDKTVIETGSFDVASFLEDMVHDATEDFLNYLTFRCEYLHDYARASPRHALEVIKCIMHTSHPKNAHDSVRPDRLAKLVVAMVEMNARFFHQLFYKLDLVIQEYLKRSGCSSGWQHPENVGAKLSIFVGRLLYELHIGRCRSLPKQFQHFARNVCHWLAELLKLKATSEYAIVSLSHCYHELRAETSMRELDTLHVALQRTPNPLNEEFRQLLSETQKIARQRDVQPRERCSRIHKTQVADLNDEENKAFEQFLQEMRSEAVSNHNSNNHNNNNINNNNNERNNLR
ncbi:uncharacterized protein LOC111267239 isoform X1 [Varroa jacobsoni]|uniref:uncharacterized protein LOC111267239 isoform X1 n=2 Tax=Varroa jacobsoni TaxID=62625 RepID=UPI000BF86493|nr:uncharacterized protein LOC111267239 isoform X1 [Varroa jacobsoni]